MAKIVAISSSSSRRGCRNSYRGPKQEPSAHKKASSKKTRERELAAASEPQKKSGRQAPDSGASRKNLRSRAATSSEREGTNVPHVQRIILADINADDNTCQCRFSGWQHADLRDSLAAQGQHQPVHLRGEGPPYTIVDGFRRHAAARELGWETIDAIIHSTMPDDQAKRIAFATNVARKNLSTLEKINAVYQAEQDHGLTRQEQADLFGVDIRTIKRWHEFCSFPEHLKRIVDGKTITIGHAKLMRDFKVRNAPKWASRIEAQGWSTRGLEKALVHEKGRRERGKPKPLFTKTNKRINIRAISMSVKAPPREKQQLVDGLMRLLDAIHETLEEGGESLGTLYAE